jgi:hypothetical protein
MHDFGKTSASVTLLRSIVTHEEHGRFKNMLRGTDNTVARQGCARAWVAGGAARGVSPGVRHVSFSDACGSRYTGSEDKERLQARCSECVRALQVRGRLGVVEVAVVVVIVVAV